MEVSFKVARFITGDGLTLLVEKTSINRLNSETLDDYPDNHGFRPTRRDARVLPHR